MAVFDLTSGKSITSFDVENTEPSGQVAYLIRDVNRLFNKVLSSRLANYNVSIGQWSFLLALWEEDGITQRELSKRVGMREPTTVTALQGMERSNLIKRVRDTEDRRKMNVYLTERGYTLRGELLQLASEVSEQALDGITTDQTKLLAEMLVKMNKNLQEQDD